MKNILNYLLLIIITGTFVSCDDKIRSLEDLNREPEFQYFRQSSINWETPNSQPIIDSAKMFNTNNNASYPAILRVLDVNNNIAKINISSNDSQNSFFVNDNVYYSDYEVSTNKEFNVAFRNSQFGTFDYRVKAIDDFGKANEMIFRITFKENRKPIAKVNIVLINGNTKNYQLTGKDSFDVDKAIGGTIVEYEFLIDNIIIKTSEPQINHIFTVGSHNIKFRVMDNDNEWSEYINYNLTVS